MSQISVFIGSPQWYVGVPVVCHTFTFNATPFPRLPICKYRPVPYASGLPGVAEQRMFFHRPCRGHECEEDEV
jgi:hypothetical protein